MTEREMRAILSYLAENWPSLRDGDVTHRTAVWLDALGTFDYATMLLAARDLVRTRASYPPVIADLAESYAAVRRRQEMSRAETHGLPEGGGLRVLSYDEGMRVAWESYCRARQSRGHDPEPRVFHRWLTTLPDPNGR